MADIDFEIPLPFEHDNLVGHADAIAEFEKAAQSGQLHHAWLMTGPKGIGKSTLAFRFARFILGRQTGNGVLDIAGGSAAARKIASMAHPNLLYLERATDIKTGKQKTEITVDVVRRTNSFFGSTAGEGGWRVTLIDTADELNIAAANALLKVLEEPPEKSIFLLISNQPGRLLPTIRSRCRTLPMKALTIEQTTEALSAHLDEQVPADALTSAARSSGGSVGRAMQLMADGGLELQTNLENLLHGQSADWPQIHLLAGQLAGRDAERRFKLFITLWQDQLSGFVHAMAQTNAPQLDDMKRVAQFHETLVNKVSETEGLNLDKKQMLLSLFDQWFLLKSRLQTPLEA